MNYSALREELSTYYADQSYKDAALFLQNCTKKLDAMYTEGMNSYEMKVMQYKTITDMFEPVLFLNSPFYYETGIIPGWSDGARDFHGLPHAGGWTYRKNNSKFIDQDPQLWETKTRQLVEKFYLICGEYNDTSQHFMLDHRMIFNHGLKGVYEKALRTLSECTTDKEKLFLNAVCEGLLCIKEMAEKFAHKAESLLALYPENKNLQTIAKSAGRCPWEKPASFYEALNVYAFMRKIIGSLEGIGLNTFGRIDMDLYPFYAEDLRSGKLTKEEAQDLISRFLITFDSHYSHDKKMEGYADHELECTYVLGGCDSNGKPYYNELTKMFLQISYNETIIFPKIKCRFSADSDKEYLDLINGPVLKGTSTILYQNDDTAIPSLIKAGYTPEEARDYLVTGCWGTDVNCMNRMDHGAYVNILKPFEYSIYNDTQKQAYIGMNFSPIENAQSFDEVYEITCNNISTLFCERLRILRKGGQIWEEVDPLPIFSSMHHDCLSAKKDFTNGGSRYCNDVHVCMGFPDLVDSLLAIKTLCFDEKRHSLKELLNAVRCNWEGYEDLRAEALHCPGWGDGKEQSCALAKKLNHDLYRMTDKLTGIYGGKILLGHMTYTEIRFWGEKTQATPNGRFNGDYIAQGLTPSRLKDIPSVTDVIHSFTMLDKNELAGNTVTNIILPETTRPSICEAIIRTIADTAIGSLQLNCVSKQTLQDAQKHPEKYPHLIIRVCGFSAKFTSLSPEWQQEIITRNYYR